MAQKFADLHIHTSASDGTYSAEEVLRRAKEAGLAAVGIADHDSVEGIRAALEVDEKYGVEVIPGIELSSEHGETEIHILGYFLDWDDRQFRALLDTIQKIRLWRAEVIVGKLQRLGIDISFEEILSEAKGGSIGRPHIVRVMLRHGHVKTPDEAFERYLRYGRPAYVGKYELGLEDAIKLIRKLRGVPVLAHPVFSNVDDRLPELIKIGLRGIEAYHSRQDQPTSKRYAEFAQKYGLIVTGGSDSHGAEDPIGCVRVPYDVVQQLKSERKSIMLGGKTPCGGE
ncbi:MAG: PHP domain-containing protein [Candidatus Hodarchaeaceae archaeon]|nr:PHP domain-containing protein [Candidatus Hodarchaeaceae archaeon]